MSTSYIGLKQLLVRLQNVVRQNFPASYWVKGEVAGVRKIGSHIYFDLIELERGAKVAQVRACAFLGEGSLAVQSFERVTGQKFSDGIKIGARVTVNYHPVYGLSLVLCEIDAQLTLGGIELQRKETLKKLLADHPGVIQFKNGSFITPNKLLSLSRVIQRIALVTSASSDAYSDFTHSLTNNEYGYKFKVDLYNVLVQGYGTQSSLFDAFSKVRVSGISYDAIVLSRGGGAPADFLPFDDYHLCLTIAKCSVPVITGIGHHLNQGISDFFARVHTNTPSTAAQFIIGHNQTFEKKVREIARAVQNISATSLSRKKESFQRHVSALPVAIKALLSQQRSTLNQNAALLTSGTTEYLSRAGQTVKNLQFSFNTKAASILVDHRRKLDDRIIRIDFGSKQIIREKKLKSATLESEILHKLPRLLTSKQRELMRLQELIAAANPDAILKRGFAILKKDGRIIAHPDELQSGDDLQILQHQSIIETTVKSKKDYDGREFKL